MITFKHILTPLQSQDTLLCLGTMCLTDYIPVHCLLDNNAVPLL